MTTDIVISAVIIFATLVLVTVIIAREFKRQRRRLDAAVKGQTVWADGSKLTAEEALEILEKAYVYILAKVANEKALFVKVVLSNVYIIYPTDPFGDDSQLVNYKLLKLSKDDFITCYKGFLKIVIPNEKFWRLVLSSTHELSNKSKDTRYFNNFGQALDYIGDDLSLDFLKLLESMR